MTDYQKEKKTAEELINESLSRMTETQKEHLADVLLGAALASKLIAPCEPKRG